MMKKKILVVVHTNTWFTEMERVSDLLQMSEDYSPHVHFAYIYPTLTSDIQKLQKKEIAYSTTPEEILAPVLDGKTGYYLSKIWSFIVLFLRHWLKSQKEISFYKQLISDAKADLVVIGGDLVGYNTPEIVKASHALDKPCVVVPSTMSDGTEQAEAYFFDPQFSSEKLSNQIAGWLWPKWKKNHKNKELVRLPAAHIFSRQISKTDPALPWVSSSTRADAIAVESQAMKDYYLRCGIENNLLRTVGSLANDVLAENVRLRSMYSSELISTLNLDKSKMILLTALPPDSLYMPGGRPECEFKNYKELTLFWVQAFKPMKNFNTVISLHPSVNIEDFRYLESENVKISQKPIVELIPLCDLFVASVSSTIRWAIACGKPVINYDVYHYRYADFVNVKGVVYLDQSHHYRETILKIDQNQSYLQELNQIISTDASYWGNLDGQEGKRLLQLFSELIEKYNS